ERHQQQFDAGADVERRRIYEPLQMRKEPAREAGEHAGEHEYGQPRAERAYAQALDHGDAAAQAADGAALAAIKEVAAEQHPAAEQGRDEEIIRGGIGEREGPERDRRDTGEPAVAAERVDVAEQKEDRDAPGDGAQRQEMSAEPQSRRP